jgi:hypothetical protein
VQGGVAQARGEEEEKREDGEEGGREEVSAWG